MTKEKIFIDHHEPFLLAHGGLQIQIEQTMAALEAKGLLVERLRWWDSVETPEMIHFFGVPPLAYAQRARAKKIPMVVTHLLTTSCNRHPSRLFLQGIFTRLLQVLPGLGPVNARMGWLSLKTADAVVVGLEAERRFLTQVWGIPEHRIHKVPLGVHRAFLERRGTPELPSLPERFLLSVGTICERKRSLEIARFAAGKKIPMVFVGASLAQDAYFTEFMKETSGSTVLYLRHISDPVQLSAIYRQAAGFVHFSDGENWCLSAHEAAACGCPLLLPDQPWSRERFGSHATYWNEHDFRAEMLATFFRSPGPATPQKIPGWETAADGLLSVYQAVRKNYA